jgi:hypothetical protein
MRRTLTLVALATTTATVSAIGVASCKGDTPTTSALVVAVTSEPVLGGSLDQVTITASRNGAPVGTASVRPPDAGDETPFPLTLWVDSGGDTDTPIDVEIVGSKAGKRRVVRTAKVGLVAERTKLLPVSLR